MRFNSEIGTMLRRLYIRNFALINEMDVHFPGKLSVITGETGAGKSIFIEALSLVLGKRADNTSLSNKSKKCIIEAEFDASDLDLRDFFEREKLDEEKILLLRREINPEGKSRSFLNDTPVNLNALKFLAEHLIDVHSQHQNLLLNQSNFQLELLDVFAESAGEFKQYRNKFAELQKLRSDRDVLFEQETQAKKELDYYQFLSNELDEANLSEGKLRSLEEESTALEHAESIKGHLLKVSAALTDGDKNLLSDLQVLKQSLQSVLKYSTKYTGYYERINSAYIDLKELSAELENEGNEISVNEEKLNAINTTIDQINRLLKKHGVKTEEELLKAKAEIEHKLQGFNSVGMRIEELNKAVALLEKECDSLAKRLSKQRNKATGPLEKEVKRILNELAMPNAVFKVELNEQTTLSSTGYDKIRFLFSANKGGTPAELNKVASGGELSRLMLSLKSLMANKKELPAIIFDEIDTGVSGDVADKIGIILSEMGKNRQVITITHLPQIASKGSHHLYVYKKDSDTATESFMKELSKTERITEIAKMLSTDNPTQSALKNAKDLLNA